MKLFLIPPKYTSYTVLRTLILLLCVQIFFGCERRPLTYDYQEGVPFRLELDWSALGGAEQPFYVKALFFPVSGGKVVERYVKPEGEEIKVPPGKYNIIVYTWRTNAAAQTVQFRGETYDTFEAYTEEKYQRLPLQRAATDIPVVPQPDALYAWNSRSEPVEITYSKGVQGKSAQPNTLTAVMQSMVREYEFEVNVRNAEEIHSMYAVLTHVYGSKPLGGGTENKQQYGLLAQEVILVSKTEDISTYRCHVTAFSFHATDKSFIVNITNKTGGGQQEEINITESIDDRDNGVIPPTEPIVIAPKEDPIVVERKEVGGGGFVPPTLDDWNKKDENIEL